MTSPRDLDDVFRELEVEYPGLGRRIVDDQGKIRTYVNVFVNSRNSRELRNEKTRLNEGDVVHILPSIAGG